MWGCMDAGVFPSVSGHTYTNYKIQTKVFLKTSSYEEGSQLC